jgi:hypothetical protein
MRFLNITVLAFLLGCLGCKSDNHSKETSTGFIYDTLFVHDSISLTKNDVFVKSSSITKPVIDVKSADGSTLILYQTDSRVALRVLNNGRSQDRIYQGKLNTDSSLGFSWGFYNGFFFEVQTNFHSIRWCKTNQLGESSFGEVKLKRHYSSYTRVNFQQIPIAKGFFYLPIIDGNKFYADVDSQAICIRINSDDSSIRYGRVPTSEVACGSGSCNMSVIGLANDSIIVGMGCGANAFKWNHSLDTYTKHTLFSGFSRPKNVKDCGQYDDLDLDMEDGFRWNLTFSPTAISQYTHLPKYISDGGSQNISINLLVEEPTNRRVIKIHRVLAPLGVFLNIRPSADFFYYATSDKDGVWLRRYRSKSLAIGTFTSLTDIKRHIPFDAKARMTLEDYIAGKKITEDFLVWFPTQRSCKACSDGWVTALLQNQSPTSICVVSDKPLKPAGKNARVLVDSTFGDKFFKSPVINPVIYAKTQTGYRRLNETSEVDVVAALIDSITSPK